eukprot:468670-Lingulodinium_polyedra.AAC.1
MNLFRYFQKFPNSSRAFMLGQDADVHGQQSTETYLNTIIKNVGLLWSTRDKRWIFPSEMLLFQGFAADPRVKVYREPCSFDIERQDLALPGRRRNVILQQCGNSMHVQVMGLSLLWSLGYVG